MLASIILGFYATVVSYQELSFYMGICYVVAALLISDEYNNDILDMPKGSCFPSSQSGSTTPTFSRPASFKNPPSRSSSFTTSMIELKPLVFIDSLFHECRGQGKFMVLPVKEIDDAKFDHFHGPQKPIVRVFYQLRLGVQIPKIVLF